jgi:hypothetical protein
LRAPDFYFEVMREFGRKFVPLGEIVEIRRGITSGCDDFFMPHDITREALEFDGSDRDFRRAFGGVDREAVRSGVVKIVRAGDGSKHPIEAKYLRPEFHTLRDFQKVEVDAADCDRSVILVKEPRSALRGTWIAEYLRYGETQTFSSGKSKPVPVPKRSTCAARDPWYDLTGLVKPGIAFWPMAHHYRHVIPFNRELLICNHRMFDMSAPQEMNGLLLAAILNSTIVALWKTFYGRFTGMEGSLDTEVIDVRMIEIPEPSATMARIAQRMVKSFEQMGKRQIGRMVEEQLMECHSSERAAKIAAGPLVLPEELRQPDRHELDDAVFELLGVDEPARRRDLVDRLYAATATHFREIRVVEIQKMEQRAKSKVRRFGTEELATDAWDAVYFRDQPPLGESIAGWPEPKVKIVIPVDGSPRLLDERSMFDREVVFFGDQRGAQRVVCSSRAQAELVTRLAELGFRGQINICDEEASCRQELGKLEAQLRAAEREFETIASERVADEKNRAEMVALLMHWRIHGKTRIGMRERAEAVDESETVER